jgi:hypothetical protein
VCSWCACPPPDLDRRLPVAPAHCTWAAYLAVIVIVVYASPGPGGLIHGRVGSVGNLPSFRANSGSDTPNVAAVAPRAPHSSERLGAGPAGSGKRWSGRSAAGSVPVRWRSALWTVKEYRCSPSSAQATWNRPGSDQTVGARVPWDSSVPGCVRRAGSKPPSQRADSKAKLQPSRAPIRDAEPPDALLQSRDPCRIGRGEPQPAIPHDVLVQLLELLRFLRLLRVQPFLAPPLEQRPPLDVPHARDHGTRH